jgi:acyl-CoA dehydrogenase
MVGNKPLAIIVQHKGSPQQKEEFIPKLMSGEYQMAFGLTEPAHGSDATHMDTNARREANDWIINGEKTWNTGAHLSLC